MLHIPDSARQEIERLLPDALPTRWRAVAVLDGVLAGRLWTDDVARPTWAVVIESADGTVYGGGDLTGETVVRIMGDAWTSSGDLIFGFTGPDDPVRRLLPDDPYYIGAGVDFTDRDRSGAPREPLAAAIPDGLELVELDAERLPHAEWGEDTLLAFGSADAWTERGIGRCLVDRDGAIVAHAMAGPRVRDAMEMGIWVHEGHRRQGLGALLSAHTALAAEAAGAEVWWNTNATNAGSIAIARRLGFARERRYDFVAYRTRA